MKTKQTLHCFAAAGCFLIAAAIARAELLPNNFWPNPDFEEGTNLSDPAGGTLAGWNRGGGDPTICQISTKAFSGSYALSVVDAGNSYGEFYSPVSLAGRVTGGDTIDLRWQEVYQLAGGEMRVTLVFQDSSGSLVGVKHFTKTGSSAGFGGSLDEAQWVQRDETADVPEGAVTLQISLVSGGPLNVTGVYVIDELSVARHPAPILLANNLWTNNPTFEEGTDLDLPTGTLTQWNRGGSAPDICQVSLANSISPTHSLAVIDNGTSYGEWYSDLPLSGVAQAGDTLNLQWFEMFNVSGGGEMRLSIIALSGTGATVDAKHFTAHGQSAGWTGTPEGSPFAKRNETYTLPAGVATLRVSLVSGGSQETTGLLIVDDLSINKAAPTLPDVLAGNVWVNPGFEEGSDLDTAAGTPVGWSRGGSTPALCVVTHDNSVSPTHALAVVDDSVTGYAEWYSNLRLGASTGGGKLLDLQWFEAYSIPDGEMRLTVLFFDPANALLGETHFVARANSSGWKTSLADSSFTRRNEQVAVPPGSTRMQISLFSGGPESSVGTLAIDNLSVAPAANAPVALFGSFWSNPGFEEGTDLDNPHTGKPAGWDRGGADVSIDQVLTSAFQSSTHALAVVDQSTTSYGEWYRSFDVSSVAQPGDEIAAQWWELFSVSAGGEMRLSIVFFNAQNGTTGQKNFVTHGDSAGWGGSVPVSFFTKRNETFTIPPATTRWVVTLTSGGPADTTGVMVIDDLSFAPPLPPPDLLDPNFWVNSTFEEGVQLDNPKAGVPTGWSRGGSYIQGDLVNHEIGTSPTHSLELNDDKEDAYSEWYQNWSFGTTVHGGDTLQAQWFWVYDTVGDMRLTFVWFDVANAVVGQKDFVVHGQSADFSGDINTSPFVKEFHEMKIPDTAVRGSLNFASGGSATVKGRIILDDLSLRIVPFHILDLSLSSAGATLTWESAPDRNYQVQSSDSLSPANFQPVVDGESIPGDPTDVVTTFTDARPSTVERYYRVIIAPPAAAR